MKYEYDGVEYEGDDFYCYPKTKVLVNIFGIRAHEKLIKEIREVIPGLFLSHSV